MATRIAFLGLALMVLALAGAAEAQDELTPDVTTSAGTVSIHGAVQWLWQMQQKDPGRHVPGINQFKTRRVHLGLHGQPGERVDYKFTFALNDDDPLQPDTQTLNIGVYEAFIDVSVSPSWTTRVGFFLPPWTLTMPDAVHELDFIRHPLLVDSDQWLFTPWKQSGVMVNAHAGDEFSVFIGLMNGLDAATFGADDNNMKDTMISAAISIFPGVRFSLGHWGGKTELRKDWLNPGESALMPFGLSTTNTGATPIVAGGGLVEHSSTWLAVEVEVEGLYLGAEALWNHSDRDQRHLRDAVGYQISAIYSFNQLQAAFRYEQLDPDSQDAASADNEIEWTTFGINYNLNSNCRLMANYIFKAERGDNHRANEELLIQASIGF